jgi:hypothetical protein
VKIEEWHCREAVMLASQLPEKTEDALLVLRLATELVADFLTVDEPEMKSASVIALIGGSQRKDAAGLRNTCPAAFIPKPGP